MLPKAINAVIGIADGARFVLRMLSNLVVDRAVGPVVAAFIRASAQYEQDASGVWQKVPNDVPAFGAGGFASTPAVTNKCTCYGIIPDDTPLATQNSGLLTVGCVYEIMARSSVNFVADGAANNNVGTKFVCAAATVTLDASNTARRIQWAVGENMVVGGPANIPGFSLVTSGKLAIVDGAARIAAGGLSSVVPNGKLYRFDGVNTNRFCTVLGTGTNGLSTNISVFAAVDSGTNAIGMAGTAVGTTFSNTILARVMSVSAVMTGGNRSMYITRPSSGGSDPTYFIMPQVEQTTRSTSSSPIPSIGAATTLAATSLSCPTANNLPATGIRHISLNWTPRGYAAGVNQYLWATGTSTNGTYIIFNGSASLIFRKMVASVAYDATLTITAPTVGTSYLIDAVINADNTTSIQMSGYSPVTQANTTAPQIGATMFIGSDTSGVNNAYANFGQSSIGAR